MPSHWPCGMAAPRTPRCPHSPFQGRCWPPATAVGPGPLLLLPTAWHPSPPSPPPLPHPASASKARWPLLRTLLFLSARLASASKPPPPLLHAATTLVCSSAPVSHCPHRIRPNRAAVHLHGESLPTRRLLQIKAPPHPPSFPELQGHTFVTADHWSSPAAVERCRPKLFAPPHRRLTSLVRSCPLLLARRNPRVPLVLAGSTFPPVSRHWAVDKHATGPPVSAPSARVLRRQPRAIFLAGPGHQAKAHVAFGPATRGRSPRHAGWFAAQYCVQ
jgi:hypothetical protein